MKVFNIVVLVVITVLMISCGSSKQMSSSNVEPSVEKIKNLEGESVLEEKEAMTGYDISKVLSEDGTDLINRPIKWFKGIAKADDKQMAIEMAQREAYATISTVFSNMVDVNAEKGKLANNGKTEGALRSHWEQISQTVLKGCEPYGDVVTQYSKTTKMYSVKAMIGIRGDKFAQIMKDATNFKPEGLTEEETKEFIEVNQNIMSAAKGQ